MGSVMSASHSNISAIYGRKSCLSSIGLAVSSTLLKLLKSRRFLLWRSVSRTRLLSVYPKIFCNRILFINLFDRILAEIPYPLVEHHLEPHRDDCVSVNMFVQHTEQLWLIFLRANRRHHGRCPKVTSSHIHIFISHDFPPVLRVSLELCLL